MWPQEASWCPPPYPRHPSEHRCWHRAPCALSRPPGVAALAELGLPLGFHDLPFCAECKPHPHPQSTGLQARAFPINSDAWSISSEDGWAGLSTDSLERRLLWGLRQWKRREPLPARKALPCARPAVRACPARCSRTTRGSQVAARTLPSALTAPGQRRRVLSPRRARRAGPGDAGCPRSPGARGGQAWPGASGARVSRLSPCGPGPASCPGLAGRGLRAASLGGRERLAGRARWAGAPSPAVLTPSAAARGDVPPQDRVAAGLPEA